MQDSRNFAARAQSHMPLDPSCHLAAAAAAAATAAAVGYSQSLVGWCVGPAEQSSTH
jgi:hypothetical protein